MNVFTKTFAAASISIAAIGAFALPAQADSRMAPDFFNTEQTAAAARANADYRAHVTAPARSQTRTTAPLASSDVMQYPRGYGF